ncbi:MAG: hypothetical protein U0174_07415 [Polyangiaceae bacterium]
MSSRTNLTLGVLICFALGAFGCAVDTDQNDPELGTDESALMNEQAPAGQMAGAALFYSAVHSKTLAYAYDRALKNPENVLPSRVTQARFDELVLIAQKSGSLGEFLRKSSRVPAYDDVIWGSEKWWEEVSDGSLRDQKDVTPAPHTFWYWLGVNLNRNSFRTKKG